MLCARCRRKAAAFLDERIRLLEAAVADHAGIPAADAARETAETYLDAYQEVRHRLVGHRLTRDPSG